MERYTSRTHATTLALALALLAGACSRQPPVPEATAPAAPPAPAATPVAAVENANASMMAQPGVQPADDSADARALAERAQRAGIQVHRVPEDRELAPIARERMSPGGRAGVQTAGEWHRRSIYRRKSAPGTPRE